MFTEPDLMGLPAVRPPQDILLGEASLISKSLTTGRLWNLELDMNVTLRQVVVVSILGASQCCCIQHSCLLSQILPGWPSNLKLLVLVQPSPIDGRELAQAQEIKNGQQLDPCEATHVRLGWIHQPWNAVLFR